MVARGAADPDSYVTDCFDEHFPSARKFLLCSKMNEMAIAVMNHGAAFKGNFQFKFFIALATIEIVAGRPAADVIEALVDKTQCIVSAIEAEAIRV